MPDMKSSGQRSAVEGEPLEQWLCFNGFVSGLLLNR
jgi:hypothetical protein